MYPVPDAFLGRRIAGPHLKVAESEQNFVAHRERVCATISPNVGARFGDLSKLIQLN